MRSHNAILRKIAELNLDPKIPYVSDGNRSMVPKFKNNKEDNKIEYILGKVKEEKNETVTVEQVSQEIAVEQKENLLDTHEDVKESSELNNDIVDKKEEEVAIDETVKKKFPFQKKKVTPST